MNVAKLVVAITVLGLVAACKKGGNDPVPPPSEPPMDYIDLGGQQITMGKAMFIDLDGDGKRELKVATELWFDNLYQVAKDVYLVNTSITANILVNDDEQTPWVVKGSPIGAAPAAHAWYNVAECVMMQRVYDSSMSRWEGNWRDKEHAYLPVQVLRGGKTYNGWVELSVTSGSGTVTAYRAGVCKVDGVAVKAGY